MITIELAHWPRLRLVVEVLYRPIEQDGIADGPAWLTEQGIGWSWATPAPRLEPPQWPRRHAP